MYIKNSLTGYFYDILKRDNTYINCAWKDHIDFAHTSSSMFALKLVFSLLGLSVCHSSSCLRRTLRVFTHAFLDLKTKQIKTGIIPKLYVWLLRKEWDSFHFRKNERTIDRSQAWRKEYFSNSDVHLSYFHFFYHLFFLSIRLQCFTLSTSSYLCKATLTLLYYSLSV